MPPDPTQGPFTGKPPSSASRIIRRVHMYLGLFLVPWMLMYAASTMVMNHRELVESFYSSKQPAMVRERELEYTREFSPETKREQMAEAILEDLGLEGTHRVSGGNGKPIVIDRHHAFAPRKITWNPGTKKLVIEKQEFRSATFLERMHRRRGYQHPYALEDSWGFSVDVAVTAMVFWSLSGLWLWWELRPTRLWGALCGGVGLIVFTLFVTLL
jgi:hypothetical protein